MTNKSKSLLLTGLVLPVIAGVIVQIFTSINILGFIFNCFKAVFAFFETALSVPLWGLILLLIAGIVVPRILASKKKPQNQSSYTRYTYDRILGVNWQWRYSHGDVVALVPICPNCSYQPPIQMFYPGGYIAAGENSLIQCDHCGFKIQFDYPPEILTDRIEREIHRKIRTGEYVNSINHGGSG